MSKTRLLNKEQKKTAQGRGGPRQEKHWCWEDEVWLVFKTGLLVIHLVGSGLTVLIDS